MKGGLSTARCRSQSRNGVGKDEGDSSQETTPDAEIIEDVKHDVPENNKRTELKTIDITLPDLGEGIEGAEVSGSPLKLVTLSAMEIQFLC